MRYSNIIKNNNMKNLLYFLISFILGTTTQLKGQSVTISSQDLSKYYGEEVLKIANIIHNAMLEGKITVFANDSLVRKLSPQQYKKNTIQEKQITFMINEFGDTDPENFKDSIIFVPQQPIADLGVCYKISPNLYPSIKQDIIAVGPILEYEYPVVENGNSIRKTAPYMPGCVRYSDLKLLLNKNQMIFLNSYAWLKALYGKKTEDYINFWPDQKISKISGNLTKNLGEEIEYHLTALSFRQMINGKFPIYTKDSTYNIQSFLHKNSMMIVASKLKAGGDPSNPDDLIDSVFLQIPNQFDRVGLKWYKNKTYLVLYFNQDNESTIVHSELYLVELEKIKHLMIPAEYNLLDLYFKLRTD